MEGIAVVVTIIAFLIILFIDFKKLAVLLILLFTVTVNAGINDTKSYNRLHWGGVKLRHKHTYVYKYDGYKITAHYRKGLADWVRYEKKGLTAQSITAYLSVLGNWLPVDKFNYNIYTPNMMVRYRGIYRPGSFTVKYIKGGRW